jgi:hypothetical protein
MSWDDLSKNDMLWPSVREVNEYRRQVYRTVRQHIQDHPALDALPVTWVSPVAPKERSGGLQRLHASLRAGLVAALSCGVPGARCPPPPRHRPLPPLPCLRTGAFFTHTHGSPQTLPPAPRTPPPGPSSWASSTSASTSKPPRC